MPDDGNRLDKVQLRHNEKDLRTLPMAEAAVSAEDTTKRLDEKLKDIDQAIEYSEEWNQDNIQIGSAYFIKGQLLFNTNPLESEECYRRGLMAFRLAGMKAEIARTELELAKVLSFEARRQISNTQGSHEWKLGLRAIGVIRSVRTLMLPEAIIVASILLVLLIAFAVGR